MRGMRFRPIACARGSDLPGEPMTLLWFVVSMATIPLFLDAQTIEVEAVHRAR